MFGNRFTGIAIVIFIVLALGIWIFSRMRSGKSHVKSTKDNKEVIAPQVEVKQEIIPPPQPAAKTSYDCLCGAHFDELKQLRQHFMKLGKKEPGKHKSVKQEQKVISAPIPANVGTHLEVGADKDYRAIIYRYAGEGKESVIEFKQKISQPLGETWYAEPSLPISGECYWVKELANGNYEAFDPRKSNLTANATPNRAYMATHWDRAEGVWLYVQSAFQKWSMIIIGAVIFITFIVILIRLGGK
jgi:hypothetical protein